MARLKDILERREENLDETSVSGKDFEIGNRSSCIRYEIKFNNPLSNSTMNKILKSLKPYTIGAYESGNRNNMITIYLSPSIEKGQLENIYNLLLRLS